MWRCSRRCSCAQPRDRVSSSWPRARSTVRPRMMGRCSGGRRRERSGRESLWGRGMQMVVAWPRCFGCDDVRPVSALMRLVSLQLTKGADDLDDLGVWLPVRGIGVALVVGGWRSGRRRRAGGPAVVVGCVTVVDPLVKSGPRIRVPVRVRVRDARWAGIGSAGAVRGIVGCAVVGLSAVLLPGAAAPARQGSRRRIQRGGSHRSVAAKKSRWSGTR